MLKTFLRQSGLGARRRDEAVFGAWNEAVGPEMARRAVPVRFRRGELLIEVDSAPRLQELKNFTGETYRREVNARLGAELVRKLAFKPRA